MIAELARAAARRGCYHGSAEQLTPVLRDAPSIAALAFVIGQALASPTQATTTATEAVTRYSITPKTIDTITAAYR